jgi:phosphoribosylaminoimidazole (AIR) synthetase
MWSTFNMGVGMILVAGPERVGDIERVAFEAGHTPYRIGRVAGPPGVRLKGLGTL